MAEVQERACPPYIGIKGRFMRPKRKKEKHKEKHMQKDLFASYHMHVLILSPLTVFPYCQTKFYIPIWITQLVMLFVPLTHSAS